MPIVKKTAAPKGAKLKKAGRAAKEVEIAVSLPTKKTTPKTNLLDYSLLLYGERKIGKTTLCSCFPDALFLLTEPGTKALSVYQREVNNWREARGYLKLLEKDPGPFKTIVVDIADLLYDLCFKWGCERQAVNHPQEANDYGNTWKVIRGEFQDYAARLLKLRCGVVFVSHASVERIERRDGAAFDRLATTLPKQAAEVIGGLVDSTFYYGYDGEKRKLIIRGSDFIVAGTRLEENFRTIGGEPVVSIPMGSNKQEGYANLIRAFENRQKAPGRAIEIKQRDESDN